MTWRHLALPAVVLLAASGALATSSASAEGERPLPWEGGAAVETGAETLFGQVASQIAGRPVSIRCNGETDWAQLAAERGFPPGETWGYVLGGTDFAELAPVVCSFLDRYAYTSPKPSYWCKGTETVTEWVQKQKRVRERKPLLKNGKPVLRKGKRVYVWKVRVVTTIVPVQRTREIVVKCEGADEWGNYSEMLKTLGHESYHLKGVVPEPAAECYGLQAVKSVAKRLGASEQEAKYVSDYAWEVYYPIPANFYSPECRSGGALDLTPGDGLWP